MAAKQNSKQDAPRTKGNLQLDQKGAKALIANFKKLKGDAQYDEARKIVLIYHDMDVGNKGRVENIVATDEGAMLSFSRAIMDTPEHQLEQNGFFFEILNSSPYTRSPTASSKSSLRRTSHSSIADSKSTAPSSFDTASKDDAKAHFTHELSDKSLLELEVRTAVKLYKYMGDDAKSHLLNKIKSSRKFRKEFAGNTYNENQDLLRDKSEKELVLTLIPALRGHRQLHVIRHAAEHFQLSGEEMGRLAGYAMKNLERLDSGVELRTKGDETKKLAYKTIAATADHAKPHHWSRLDALKLAHPRLVELLGPSSIRQAAPAYVSAKSVDQIPRGHNAALYDQMLEERCAKLNGPAGSLRPKVRTRSVESQERVVGRI